MTWRLLTAAVALACIAATPANRVAGPIAAAVAAGAQTISTVAEGASGGTLTWASWAEQVPPIGVAQRWTTHLVLLRQTGVTIRPVWHSRRPDSYEPVLRVLPWVVHSHPVLLLQFQYGAASMRMELYAVQANGLPAMRGSVEGSWIDLSHDGPDLILMAHSSSDLQDPPRCYGWDSVAAKLSAHPC